MKSLSSNEAAKIAALDAPLVASNPKQYVSANVFQYQVAVNTWCLLIEDVCGCRSAQAMRNNIIMHGLLPTISECSELANRIVASGFTLDDLGDYRYLAVEDTRLSLQVLRFLKRFTPIGADLILQTGLDNFKATNARAKGVPYRIAYSKGWSKNSFGEWRLESGPVLEYRCYYPSWLIKQVKAYLKKVYPTRRRSPLTEVEIFQKGYFSSGVTAEGAKVLADKVSAYSLVTPYFGDVMYPTLLGTGGIPDYIAVCAVPKNYKTPRIIGEVPAYFQYEMQGIRGIMEEVRAKGSYYDQIVLDDQTMNQAAAFAGSIDGCVATVDLSAASDSISHSLAEQVFDPIWFEAIEKVNPKYLMFPDNSLVRRWIWQTSGNGTTFECESALFLAIALAATATCELWLGEELIPPRVYGDDLVCDTRVYETLADFLELLGFTVNREKSFHSHGSGYRESCGVEYWCGYDTSTKYWPRKPIWKKDPESWSSLISMQHRLFEFEQCEMYLTELVLLTMRDVFHIEMTSSLPGTDCEDLWNIVPKYIPLEAPVDKKKGLPKDADQNWYRREGHYALSTVYPRALKDREKETKGHLFKIGWENQLAMYQYVQFLVHGPVYSCPLDKLLGVREKKASILASLYLGDSQWTLIPR